MDRKRFVFNEKRESKGNCIDVEVAQLFKLPSKSYS